MTSDHEVDLFDLLRERDILFVALMAQCDDDVDVFFTL